MWHQQDGMGCLLPSFPRRYTDSTIHGPIPYARNPDTSWEAPALQENAKPAAWSWLENLRLLLTTISRHGATPLGGNSRLTAFPGERKERNGLYFQCSDFSRECPKEWFLPCLNLNTDKNGPEVESYWKQGWYCGLACLYSPQLSSQHSAEKKKSPSFSLGKKKIESCIHVPTFSKCWPRLLSHLSPSTEAPQHTRVFHLYNLSLKNVTLCILDPSLLLHMDSSFFFSVWSSLY